FSSTSKITDPGGGVAFIFASKNNIDYIKSHMTVQTIGFDKIQQLRHVKFFKTPENVIKHMEGHGAFMKPKFDAVSDTFEKEFAGLGIAEWVKPNGGYFISLDVLDGCAKRAHTLAKEAGVTLTNAGATFPYGKDPRDRNLRIAPSYPTPEELTQAISVLCVCVKLAAVEKLLAE
ncbi:MAG: aminotransferase, partial [Clostridia bacterium]|nr:aminotransferase [Clostridia bacterium]